jgi:hypothetical protein
MPDGKGGAAVRRGSGSATVRRGNGFAVVRRGTGSATVRRGIGFAAVRRGTGSAAVRRGIGVAVLALAASCGGSTPADPGARSPATIARVSAETQQAVVSNPTPVQPTVVIRDASGRPVGDASVTFSVVAGGGWVTDKAVRTDANGRAATVWYLGPRTGSAHRLRAAAGSIGLDFTATATPLAAGAQYFGAKQYVELIPGELPIIISAPHGGGLRPDGIPDRTGNVTTARDINTQELAHDIAAALRARTGQSPTLVIMRLHRLKIDANREIVEAAQGNEEMERAWYEYHGYIEAARAALVAAQRPGFYIDLHGHGHPIDRIEWGYLLGSADLARSDNALNASDMVQKSSVRALAALSGAPHAQIIRGPNSLGALLEARGYPSVPSPLAPDPGGAPYFSGGYNTSRHSSRDGSLISGVQLEAHRPGLRDTPENRQRFAGEFADALGAYFDTWYGMSLGAAAAAPERVPVRLRLQRVAR